MKSLRTFRFLWCRTHLNEKMGIAVMLDVEELTKDLVDELIERIDVYGEDRVDIKWKFSI